MDGHVEGLGVSGVPRADCRGNDRLVLDSVGGGGGRKSVMATAATVSVAEERQKAQQHNTDNNDKKRELASGDVASEPTRHQRETLYQPHRRRDALGTT